MHRLRDYYTEVGAYAPGAPTPAQPPQPYPKAEIGKEYPYELLTNCALFDGRFWIADPPLHDGNGNLLPDWENPTTKGAMVLVREGGPGRVHRQERPDRRVRPVAAGS